MPEITDRSTQITELATQAAAELSVMMKAADKKDKKAAFEAYRDVLRLIGRTSINEFEGRTSLLTGLVAELSEVTRSIKVKNPVAEHLNTLAGFTEKALDLIKAEKDAADPA
jgi:hypothetical protein